MKRLTPADCLDPTGERFGIPTFPWQFAPDGYATRRQLRGQGLRPGGQDVAAQLLRPRRNCPHGRPGAFVGVHGAGQRGCAYGGERWRPSAHWTKTRTTSGVDEQRARRPACGPLEANYGRRGGR